jgi:signal transduction histidine kinase
MRRMEQWAELSGMERKRVEAVVETLATLRAGGESLAELAHDARNMVTALGLYCDLLEEPGVLASPFLHYGSELRLVAAASRRLVEKMVTLDARRTPEPTVSVPCAAAELKTPGTLFEPINGAEFNPLLPWEALPAVPIEDLAGELLANRNLLAAVAGPAVALSVSVEGSAQAVRLSGEDLTRVLVNLVKNASEAMPGGGWIHLNLSRQTSAAESAEPAGASSLLLSVEDNGAGIARENLEAVFAQGFTTHPDAARSNGIWPAAHRGLGLPIARTIVEEAGGSIHAAIGAQGGARFEIELPALSR